MLENYAHYIVDFIKAHPYWGQFFTFIIAFAESLAIVGTIIPGSVTMTAVGTLVGSAIFPPGLTIFMATLGALAGDWIGYLVGKYYANEIREFKLFKRYHKWFDNGVNFFHKHGGKSVIIGRFFGPVRSFVPLIAGILQMSTWRFTFAVIPAAFLWSVVYMLPGILLGALSLSMPAGMATKFIFYGLVAILAIWILSVIVKLFLQKIWYYFDLYTIRLWLVIRQHPRLVWIKTLLSDYHQPDRHRQLALVFIIIISSIFLTILSLNVIHHTALLSGNEPLFHLLTSLRTPQLDSIFVLITLLGSTKALLAISFLVLLTLLSEKNWRTSFYWVMNTVLIFTSTQLIKHFIYSPRPIQFISESSFPSGHTALTLGVLGFLAVIIGTHLPVDKKRLPYIIVSIVTLIMAFSRLYLGAHWLTDVIASFFLAIICVSITSIFYRRKALNSMPLMKFSITCGSIILIVWTITTLLFYNKEFKKFQIYHPIIEVNDNQWWTTNYDEIPHYQINRVGNPKFPFNIQWKDSATSIQSFLEQKGWKSYPAAGNFSSIVSRLSESQKGIHLYLLPQLYLNKPPVLMMLKSSKEKKPLYKILLWETNIFTSDDKMILIGTVSEYIPPEEKYEHNNDFNDVTPEFSKDLTGYKFQKISTTPVHNENLPQWNGVILKIKK